ncbi:MAG TPA: peroxidase family protein [Mycobacterium sp.]|nr:peroxidase family protein [Mycobacterium sp.]
MSYDEALEALKRGEYENVLKWFEALLAAERDAKACALAALARFKRQDYEDAAKLYAEALTAAGVHDPDWQKMKALAEANATAKIKVEIPKPVYFDAKTLLKPPQVHDGDLPRPLRRRWGCRCFKRLRLVLGDALGAVLTVFMNWLIEWVGRKIGYRGRIWTDWYRHGWAIGVLMLAYIREQLNAHNLISTYPRGTLVGFQKPGQRPPLGVTQFRTADGSWNNLTDPKEGAANTRFLRNVDLSVTCPEDEDRLLKPNPREISRKLLTRPIGPDGRPKMEPVEFLNLLAASWIQFMNHDWVSHGDTDPDKFIHVPLVDGDSARDRYRQVHLGIGATQTDPTRKPHGEPACTSSINEVTHWWDGSQIYGSDKDTQKRLRSGEMGKMKLRNDGTLPLATDVEDTGFRRNWWVGLTMLHTLFVREHNAICEMLYDAYPAWDDNRLFNLARLINAGVMAKIHSVEWTPAILPNQTLETGLNSNWYGLLTYLKPKAKERETVSEVNIRNPELGGIVGNPINRHHSPFGLSEEFVEVYRLHSLLPETLQIWSRLLKRVVKEVALPATRQHGSVELTKTYAMSDLFYSFGNQHPGALVLNNYPRFMQELSVAGNVFLDMGTVDIVRARERGVPRYNEFRRQLGLTEIKSFDDLTDDPRVVTRLRSAYNDNVEDLDLLIGTLAESHRPTGFGFGETVFQIFIVSASRRLQADRFYTDCYNEDVYTPEGLRWIDHTDLKTVILRHYPELADTGLANIKNAFEPWDDTPKLDPKRHPLREWDCELKPHPRRGDAYRHVEHLREREC